MTTSADEFGRASGFVTDVEHPTFGLHPRLTPFLHFSRSSTQTGRGCLLGEHTDSILAELGHGSEEIKAWRDEGVIG